MSADDWTDLDAAYLEIFGEHPDQSAAARTLGPVRLNVTVYEYAERPNGFGESRGRSPVVRAGFVVVDGEHVHGQSASVIRDP